MHQKSPPVAATFCSPLKKAMRLDEREWCDRTGKSRAQLAEAIGVSVWTLNQWLSPSSGVEMPEMYDRKWSETTESIRIYEGAEMDDHDRLLHDILTRMKSEQWRREAAAA